MNPRVGDDVQVVEHDRERFIEARELVDQLDQDSPQLDAGEQPREQLRAETADHAADRDDQRRPELPQLAVVLAQRNPRASRLLGGPLGGERRLAGAGRSADQQMRGRDRAPPVVSRQRARLTCSGRSGGA